MIESTASTETGDSQGTSAKERARFHAVRWAPLVALALLTYLLYPIARGFDAPLLDVGQVAPSEVLAPFELLVRKSPSEIGREGDALAATVRPIYTHERQIADSQLALAESLFVQLDSASNAEQFVATAQRAGIRLTPEEAEYLQQRNVLRAFQSSVQRMIRRYLTPGVAERGVLEAEPSREILVRRDGQERLEERDSFLSYSRFLELRASSHPDLNSSLGDEVFVKFLNGLFQPTIIARLGQTEALRAQLRASVDSVKDTVRAGERIIDAHEVVTPEARDRLLALAQEQVTRGGEGDVTGMIGQIFTNGTILATFWLLLMLYRRRTYDDLRQVLVLSFLFALVIVGAAVNMRVISAQPGLPEFPELIPIPFAAMLITVLVSGRASMVAAVVLAVLLGSQAAYGGVDSVYVGLIGGVVASLSVRVLRQRSQLLSAALFVSLGFLLASLTVGMQLDWTPADLGWSALRGSANAIASAGLVLIGLPVFESLARVTTDLTLLELSDPNRPLLRRLATEAPGTYAHSIAMANLCESACNAIGANGLLTRVGCYYHDIGKLKRPQFFSENQVGGINPHEKLKPDVSASIIRNHVKDGLALAEEHRLPGAIKNFIPEHHGTLEITYFLDRARSGGGDEDIPIEVYRYPGPRPRSAETAVTMLADGVEAALRVLEEPTPQKLRDVIDHLVTQRIEAGQLAEAPLTLAQLDQVKDEFVRVLGGMYHSRIEYPASSGGINAEWEASSVA